MRYLVISDLHSNLEALTGVLEDARDRGFDAVVCLGDIVGYGASPAEVIDIVRGLEPAAIVRGNHDKVACGISDGSAFHDAALDAVRWTRETLTARDHEYLRGLPEGPVDAGGFLIAHGSPLDEEEYILGDIDALDAFDKLPFSLALFGHTHFTCVIHLAGDRLRVRMMSEEGGECRLDPGARYLVNPGSTGQPRDHNPRASYALLDTSRRVVEIRRVAYDVEGAQRRILDAGLPEVLAHRLALGV